MAAIQSIKSVWTHLNFLHSTKYAKILTSFIKAKTKTKLKVQKYPESSLPLASRSEVGSNTKKIKKSFIMELINAAFAGYHGCCRRASRWVTPPGRPWWPSCSPRMSSFPCPPPARAWRWCRPRPCPPPPPPPPRTERSPTRQSSHGMIWNLLHFWDR